VRVFLPPGIEDGVTPPDLLATVADENAGIGLSNRTHDLHHRKLRLLHRFAPFVLDRRRRHISLVITCHRFPWRRQRELIYPVFLVFLVFLVYLVFLVSLASFDKSNRIDLTDKIHWLSPIVLCFIVRSLPS